MQNKPLISCALFLCILLSKSALSQEVTTIAASATVSSIVQDIESSIGNLIEDLDDVVSGQSFQLRTELMFLLSEIENTGDNLIGKSFSELNKSQQFFFENSLRTVDDIEALIDGGLDDVDEMLMHVEHIVAQVPFTKKEPRIRSFDPVYIRSTENNISEYVKISLKGSFLNHGESKLNVEGTECDSGTITESLIEFLCNKDNFTSENEVVYINSTLVVQENRGFFKKIGGLFSDNRKYKNYQFMIATVPVLLGTYKVEAILNTTQTERRNRNGTWGHVNPHCRSSRSTRSNFGPGGEGWKIDIESIRTQVTNNRRGSHRLRNVSEMDFRFMQEQEIEVIAFWVHVMQEALVKDVLLGQNIKFHVLLLYKNFRKETLFGEKMSQLIFLQILEDSKS